MAPWVLLCASRGRHRASALPSSSVPGPVKDSLFGRTLAPTPGSPYGIPRRGRRLFATSARWKEWRGSAQLEWGWDALPVRGHGSWGGVDLFEGSVLAALEPQDEVAVLTRARIRWSQAHRFWWNVPGASKHLNRLPDLLLAKESGNCLLWSRLHLAFGAMPRPWMTLPIAAGSTLR